MKELTLGDHASVYKGAGLPLRRHPRLGAGRPHRLDRLGAVVAQQLQPARHPRFRAGQQRRRSWRWPTRRCPRGAARTAPPSRPPSHARWRRWACRRCSSRTVRPGDLRRQVRAGGGGAAPDRAFPRHLLRGPVSAPSGHRHAERPARRGHGHRRPPAAGGRGAGDLGLPVRRAPSAFIDELALVDAVHDVFLLMADVRFAYEVPRVSDGWIEAYDVETRAHGCVLQARDGPARPSRQRVAERGRAPRARRGHRRGAGGAGPVGNGDGARRVHGRAPAAEDEMMTALTRTAHARWRFALAVALAAVTACARLGADAAPAARAPQPCRHRHATRRPRPRPAPPAGQVAEEPIRCWWKTDRTAVSVGERFAVVLTCASLETGQTTVVPNVSQLEGGAIQLTPFEVVSSTRRADVVATPWRYVQFEYGVRLLTDGFFGQDVSIPALTVTYNFRTADGANTGRDQSYVLPALPMRVLSLVPRGATDIRDTSAMTFGDIESARFRATVARVTSWIALAFAAACWPLLALLRASQRFRTRAPDAAKAGGRSGAAGRVRGRVARRSQGRGVGRLVAGAGTARAAGAAPGRRLGAGPAGRAAARGPRRRRCARARSWCGNGWLRRGRTMLSASTTPREHRRGGGAEGSRRPRACRAGRAGPGARGVQRRRLRPRRRAARRRRAELGAGAGPRCREALRVGALWPSGRWRP